MATQLLDEGLRESALGLCKHIAGSCEVVAACFYGPRVCGYADEKSDVDILLVLHEYRPKLRGYSKPLNGITAFTLAADQEAFERDIEQGWLGEFTAEKIITPYEPLINEEYLRRQEVRLKGRITRELLENIVSEFPELSHDLLIEAEYFLYEAMKQRARLFPPVTYSFQNMLRGNLKSKNMESMMKGYLESLNELAKEGLVTFSDGYVKVTERFMGLIKKRKFQVLGFLKPVQKAVSLYVLGILPKMMRHLTHDKEIFIKSFPQVRIEELFFQLEDPRKHLFIPTPLGSVSLSDKLTIEDFVRKAVPSGNISDMKIEELGGVLNTVYLLTFYRGREELRVVVKKFKNWHGFKWFPLALWALGTQDFAVLGRSRLEKEYAVNQFLRSQGFPVPKVLYVSFQEQMIFEDFIEGEHLDEIIKRVLSAKGGSIEETSLIRSVGRGIAEIHKLGVTLGDCKPENIIAAKDGKAYFVDLEQATRNGNQAWDIAEFLYYSGHYLSPLSSVENIVKLAREFIEGYLEAGGKKETVRKAGSVRYTKVFGFFTLPHVILAISNVCKRIGGTYRELN